MRKPYLHLLPAFVGLALFSVSINAEMSHQHSTQIKIEHAYVNAPPPVVDMAAGFLTIENHNNEDVALTSISSTAAQRIELHNTTMTDGMMKMEAMEQVTIPAHGSAQFKPGGMHLMLIGFKSTPKPGQTIPLILKFSNHMKIAVDAKVRDMRKPSPSEPAAHKHSHH